MKIDELKIEECQKVLKREIFGRIACSLKDQPYVVPFNFAFDGKKYLYAFSTVGQKIEWMRENPRVCVEVEDIKNQNDWTTVLIFGRYEELPDTPEFESLRAYAYELLSRRLIWWQPAFVSGDLRDEIEVKPVYFRINIEKITGHRGYSESFESYIPAGQPAELKKDRSRGLW